MKTRYYLMAVAVCLALMALTVSAQNENKPVMHGTLSEISLNSAVYLQIDDKEIRRAIVREILSQTKGKMIPRDDRWGSDFSIAFIKCYRRQSSEVTIADAGGDAPLSPCLFRGWPTSDTKGQMFAYTRDKSGRHRILWVDKKGENRPLEAINDFLKDASESCRPLVTEDSQTDFDNLVTADMVDTKPRITRRERARYTEEARMHHVTGEVVLSVIFRTDGRISDIRVIKGLPHGLTERSIEAARMTRFEPALLNGKPVSVISEISYTFNIY